MLHREISHGSRLAWFALQEQTSTGHRAGDDRRKGKRCLISCVHLLQDAELRTVFGVNECRKNPVRGKLRGRMGCTFLSDSGSLGVCRHGPCARPLCRAVITGRFGGFNWGGRQKTGRSRTAATSRELLQNEEDLGLFPSLTRGISLQVMVLPDRWRFIHSIYKVGVRIEYRVENPV